MLSEGYQSAPKKNNNFLNDFKLKLNISMRNKLLLLLLLHLLLLLLLLSQQQNYPDELKNERNFSRFEMAGDLNSQKISAVWLETSLSGKAANSIFSRLKIFLADDHLKSILKSGVKLDLNRRSPIGLQRLKRLVELLLKDLKDSLCRNHPERS